MQRGMRMGRGFQAQGMLRLSIGLASAYILIFGAFVFRPPLDLPSDWDLSTKIEFLALPLALFAGPMIIAGVLALLMRGLESRRVIVVFQVAYIFVALAIYYATVTGEHDAQWQLALLLIPLIGFPGVMVAGLIAAFQR